MCVIKPAQREKYNTKTQQIHKNTALDKNKNSMAGKNNINFFVKEITLWFIILKDNKIVSSFSQTQQ